MIQFLSWFIQFTLVGVLIYFFTGRLIGTRLSIFKRLFAVGLSVTITSVIYWYMFIQHRKDYYTPIEDESMFFSTLIWFASLLLITMLLHLVLELFEPVHISSAEQAKQNIFARIMTRWRLQRRLTSVLRIAFKYGIGRAFGIWRTSEAERKNAHSFRMMLEECDGIFIKFGQMLSTRKDLLPEAFTTELAELQQNIKPIPKEAISMRMQSVLGEDWEKTFDRFDFEPLASGSIGQVHQATLSGTYEKVVVKILRPDIADLLQRDLDLLISFAHWLTEESQWAENLNFAELAQNFAKGMREEIDFCIELKNMEQITNSTLDSKYPVVIPKVYSHMSNSSVLVMEYIDGVKITEADETLYRNDVTKEEALTQLFGSFLSQVMKAGIFHGDPHPGNVHIVKNTGQVALLDFGAVGRISKGQQQGIKTLFLGYHRGNARIVVDSLKHLVENDEHAKDPGFEQSVSQLLVEMAYLDHISTSQVVQSLFKIVQKHHMRLFPMVGIALRALVTLEGTIQSVSKDFDAFKEASDFAKDTAKIHEPIEKVKSLKQLAQEEIFLAWPVIKEIPYRVDQIARTIEKGEVKVKMDFTSSETNKAFLVKWLSQFLLLLVAITFGVLSVGILAVAQIIQNSYVVYLNTAAYLGLFLSLLLLVRLALQVIRDSKRNI